MQLIVKPTSINSIANLQEEIAILLPLEDFAVDYETCFSIDQIKKIRKEDLSRKIYIVINKMIYNDEIESLKLLLKEIEKIQIEALFFYDISILKLKQELKLTLDLAWNSTHMVTNYKTCNYYKEKKVKYAILSNEITLQEILEVKEKSTIEPIINLITKPTVATSRRKLVTNYNKINNYTNKNTLTIEETITKEKYKLIETKYATTFKLNQLINLTSELNTLIKNNFKHFIISEEDIEKTHFKKIIEILLKALEEKYISKEKIDEISKYVGNNTGFLYKKTIYRVKKDG